MGALSRRLFGIAIDQARFERRGFRGGRPAARERIESIGRAFLAGYHAALEVERGEGLAPRLDAMPLELRGFAYEGAAMGLKILDSLTPWRRDRWTSFLAGAGSRHVYMVHVGAGWALARLGGPLERIMERHDPLLRWLLLDGWGFHDGYFHWPRTVAGRQVPARLSGYARRAWDQGLGRALWFVDGAEAPRIRDTIASFPEERHADLWSGIGLAAAYAGGVDDAELQTIAEAAGEHLPAAAQGAAFAAEARQRAGNPAPHTERACRMLCGTDAASAAAATAEERRDLPAGSAWPAYEIWRQRLQERFAREPAVA